MMKYCCDKFKKYIFDIYRFDKNHPEKGWQFFDIDITEQPFDKVAFYFCPFCGKKLKK